MQRFSDSVSVFGVAGWTDWKGTSADLMDSRMDNEKELVERLEECAKAVARNMLVKQLAATTSSTTT